MENRRRENKKLQLSRTRCSGHARAVPLWGFKYEGSEIAQQKF